MNRVIRVLVATLTITAAATAASIDGYSFDTNDRFSNSESFIGNQRDWTGIGITASGRWGTLIDSNTIISVHHFSPSGNVTFFPGNTTTAEVVQRSIISGDRIPDTDLWVGCLDAAIPSSVTSYSYANELLTGASFGDSPYASATSWLVGRSATNQPIMHDQAIGRNAIDGLTVNDALGSGLGSDVDTLRMNYDVQQFGNVANPNYRSHESYLQIGDSGAPLFVDDGSQLRLVGVHSFVTDTNESHSSYVGNHATTIESRINQCVSSIPEPSSCGLFLLGGILFWVRRSSARP